MKIDKNELKQTVDGYKKFKEDLEKYESVILPRLFRTEEAYLDSRRYWEGYHITDIDGETLTYTMYYNDDCDPIERTITLDEICMDDEEWKEHLARVEEQENLARQEKLRKDKEAEKYRQYQIYLQMGEKFKGYTPPKNESNET